jgi:hypothetical protein
MALSVTDGWTTRGGKKESSDESTLTLGTCGRFDTTHWSVVLRAGEDRSPAGAEALERLCQTYWPPLYAFIRHRGYTDAPRIIRLHFLRDEVLAR